MVESILLTACRVITFAESRSLTNASGFFFERDDRLFLVTSRHVMRDDASGHFPERIEIELHIDAGDLGRSTMFSIPLYRNGRSAWRQGTDSAGAIDVAVIELERDVWPNEAVIRAFTPEHLHSSLDTSANADPVEIGSPLLVVGFPLGFHDTLHHLPVARHAIVASSFGLRFRGEGYFLTDARTHRGTSGAPVVMRVARRSKTEDPLPWILLGVHSARLDDGGRDRNIDEALGLNCAWYADILMTLTAS